MEYIQLRIRQGKLEYRYRLLDESTVLTQNTVFSSEWSEWIEVPKEN